VIALVAAHRRKSVNPGRKSASRDREGFLLIFYTIVLEVVNYEQVAALKIA
jgi:hypothetical protein